MLRIVTDGAADILPEWKTEYGIEMIPVNILFGEKSYLQGVELDAVVYASNLKSGQSLLDDAKKHFNHKETMISDLSISIAANLGPGTVGLILYPIE